MPQASTSHRLSLNMSHFKDLEVQACQISATLLVELVSSITSVTTCSHTRVIMLLDTTHAGLGHN